MPQYVVIGWDGHDSEALERRLAARVAHLNGIAPLFADGRMKEGGAILDEAGKMIGSTCIVEFPDRAALDRWLAQDPYVTGNVWQKIEVYPFRCAPRNGAGNAG